MPPKSQASKILSGVRNAFFLCLAAAHAQVEWGGTFSTPPAPYHWLASKVDGAYAEAKMLLAIVPISQNTEEALLAAKQTAESLPFTATNCPDVTPSEVLTPLAAGSCWNLVFDQTKYTSTFELELAGFADVAVFAEHFPTEFESGVHYLINIETGEEIEPVHELGAPETAQAWGLAISTAFLVNLMTFAGVVLIVPGFKSCRERMDANTWIVLLNSFAAGALLGTTFFLILWEPVHLLTPEYENEAQAIAVWGVSILFGFLLSTLFETISASIGLTCGHSHDLQTKPEVDIEMQPPAPSSSLQAGGNNTKDQSAQLHHKKGPVRDDQWNKTRSRMLFAIILGDFAHNFVDGVFIAVGFSACDPALGWTIVAATIGHELVQEIADFQLLTGDAIGLPTCKAFIINFIAGTSVIFGAIFGMAVELSDEATSIMLCIGGGVYMQIAATEAMPRMLAAADTPTRKWAGLVSFAVAASAIGLVLLNHVHCDPSGDAHAH